MDRVQPKTKEQKMTATELKKILMPIGFEKNVLVNRLVDCWVSTIRDLPHPDAEELDQVAQECLDKSITLREALEKLPKKELLSTLLLINKKLDKSLADSQYQLEWDKETDRWVLQNNVFCSRIEELIKTLR